MNLRYIALHMDHESGYKDPFRDNFNLNSRFICNYLSIQIRKLQFETDGTFNMISVAPSNNITDQFKIVGEKSLKARVSFNKSDYDQMNKLEKYEYYMQLLEEGYRICAQHKEVPCEHLLKLHQGFRENGYKNEWIHKQKKFKDKGIEVVLNCFFSSFDFHLVMSVNDLRSHKELVSGTVIRTLPDEVCFEHLFKDVIINNDKLIITSFQNEPKFIFNLFDLKNERFSFEILDDGLNYIPYTFTPIL